MPFREFYRLKEKIFALHEGEKVGIHNGGKHLPFMKSLKKYNISEGKTLALHEGENSDEETRVTYGE